MGSPNGSFFLHCVCVCVFVFCLSPSLSLMSFCRSLFLSLSLSSPSTFRLWLNLKLIVLSSHVTVRSPSPAAWLSLPFLSLETCSLVSVLAQMITHNLSTSFTEQGTLSKLHRWGFDPHYLPHRLAAPGHLSSSTQWALLSHSFSSCLLPGISAPLLFHKEVYLVLWM